ncbi:MAG TPA: sialidase family protein, partial [Solirubrobacteraceae bacterium]
MNRRPAWIAALLAAAVLLPAGGASAATAPVVVRDVLTGTDPLGTIPVAPGLDPIQDYVQPDTEIEPSIAVNPANPLNAVTVYQEGRIASGGDATNGFATTFDGGATWIHGELPGLTTYPGQGGAFERASDAVVAFGPDNLAYANSLVFDATVGGGLRSGMAVNVSKDGGRTWSPPVILQDDRLGGTNDKNWIVVDNIDAPGHHKGRVYVVWDRVAPVVYDYCDHDCDQLSNWLPTLQILDPVVFPGQGIGAYPMVLNSGALGIVIDTATFGAPTGHDEPEPAGDVNHVFIAAPAAGSTPYPSPLAFLPPIQISQNRSSGVPAQRASDGLPAAAVDPKSGALYAVWDDARFRTDGKNDVVIATSTDEGATWSAPTRVSAGPKDDKVDHYLASIAVGEDGAVRVSYRQRDESAPAPLFTDQIDTYYQESRDGAKTWSEPLKVNAQPSRPWYGAFSRNGTFEGDYEQTASAGGYTYITRDQGAPASPGEPPPLTRNDATTIALTEAG